MMDDVKIRVKTIRKMFPTLSNIHSPKRIVKTALHLYAAQQRAPASTTSTDLRLSIISDKIDGLQRQLTPSSNRGQIGEHRVEKWISTAFPDAIIDNRSSLEQSGDFAITFNDGGIILIEVKNYTSTVPTSQLDKFCRDLQKTPDVVFGIFVSIGQRVAKHARCSIIQHSGKYVIIVPNADRHSFTWGVIAGRELIKMMSRSPSRDAMDHVISTVTSRLDTLSDLLKKSKTSLLRMQREVKNMTTFIEQIHLTVIDDIKKSLDAMIEIPSK